MRHFLRLSFTVSLILLDLASVAFALELAYWARFTWAPLLQVFPVTKGVPEVSLYHQALVALLPVCGMVFFYAGFYKEALLSAYDEFILVLRGVFLCSLLAMAMTFAYRGAEYSRLTIALWSVASVVLIYGWREADKWFFRRLLLWFSGPQRALVIGKGKVIEAIKHASDAQPFVRSYFMEGIDSQKDLSEYIATKRISEVVILQSLANSREILETAQTCESHSIPCHVVPDLLEMRRGEIVADGFCGLPTFTIKSLSLFGSNYFLKRSFDLAASIGILAVLAIPFLVIALLIRMDSRGTALFTQDRMGFQGKKFKLFKFRTMIVDADLHIDKLKHLSDRSGPVFKMKKDPRITQIGRWLRRFSLDELPQIINVIKGDMSLVGPRPQVLWEAAAYDEHAKKRLRLKPGITGLWQVSGRASLSYEEMINLDVFYLENWSLGLDLKILLRTLPAVFAKEGAY